MFGAQRQTTVMLQNFPSCYFNADYGCRGSEEKLAILEAGAYRSFLAECSRGGMLLRSCATFSQTNYISSLISVYFENVNIRIKWVGSQIFIYFKCACFIYPRFVFVMICILLTIRMYRILGVIKFKGFVYVRHCIDVRIIVKFYLNQMTRRSEF